MVDLRWILETLPVGIWVARVPSGEVTYANPEFRAILGMDAVEGVPIAGASETYRIFDRDGRLYPVDKLPFSRVVATGRPVIAADLVIHRADDAIVNIRVSAYPKFGEDGQLTHVVIAFIDISAEVKAEMERAQIEARLAMAATHAPIVIWAADLDGVITVSQGSGLAALGVTSGELVGENLFELYADNPKIVAALRRGLAGDSFWYTAQIGRVTYDTYLMPLRNASGAVVGLSGLSNDVSEVRMLQVKTIQNDRAVALGTLASSIAHEINNPLTYMLGHQDLLHDTLAGLDQTIDSIAEPGKTQLRLHLDRIQKALDPIRSGTERIAAITRELRTFNRPAVQKSEHVDVKAVVDSVLKLVGKELEARAHLELMLEDTAPVLGDRSRLAQVVLNLAVNAMQALTGHRPEAESIWIRTGNEGHNVVIEISDSGPGVPAEDYERIFDPFVTTKDVGEGSGLGLFVSRNIVRDFGGALTVSERRGGGAVFRVELPQATPQAEANPAPSKRPRASAPASVLIVEDEAMVADLMARQLTLAGYQASVEQDARRALEVLVTSGDAFDLVFCDLMMKQMSGMDLADALMNQAPEQLKKVVFMTGGAFTPKAQAFRDRIGGQCLDKPFDILEETSRRLQALKD